MEQYEERQIRMDEKLDRIIKWIDKHDTLHARLGIGVFLLLLGVVVGFVV